MTVSIPKGCPKCGSGNYAFGRHTVTGHSLRLECKTCGYFTAGWDCLERWNDKSEWIPASPPPYPHGLIPWLWKRLTGWRDDYGRKAHLCRPFIDFE